MIKRFTKWEQRLLFVCLIVVIAYFGNGMIQSQNEKIDAVDDAVNALHVQLRKNLKVIKKAEVLTKKYEGVLDKWRQKESDEQEMARILSEIEGVAGQLGLKISDLKPNKPKRQEYYNKFSVGLSIDSSFVRIIKFLHILQEEPFMFDVVSVQFDKGSGARSSTVRTRLVLKKVRFF